MRVYSKMQSLIIPSKTVTITDNTYYPIVPKGKMYGTYEKENTINLRDIELLKGYDIVGIHVEFPDNLKYIVIIIGQTHLIYDKHMQEYLKTLPIYLTLCKYFEVYISFIYDDEWFEKNIEFVEFKEYEEEDEYGDEVTIWDGYEYYTGNIVLGKIKKETGKMLRKITRGAEVTLPEIRFDISNVKHKNDYITHPIRQRITIIDKNYMDRLIKSDNLTMIDENSGYIDNKIVYYHGFGSLYYSF